MSLLFTVFALLTVATGAETGGAKVILDGREVAARWSDGDTFSWTDARGEKQRARLKGYNTLESFGPVHRWGNWTAAELYDWAKKSGERARSEVWRCRLVGESGGYGRVLVDCPELRRVLVEEGYAHLFEIDNDAPPDELALQASAIARGRGIWEKGAPEGLITSVHSAQEGYKVTYDRVCSLKTGRCGQVEHKEFYSTCQEVCREGSCMTYVPYEERYFGGKRAPCLLSQTTR